MKSVPDLFRRFLAGGGEKALPEGAFRPLFAAAEQRPADAALVVLGARQGQRRQDDEALVGQAAGLLRQAQRPIGVVEELFRRDAVAGPAVRQPGEGSRRAAGRPAPGRAEFQRLLILVDVPAVGVVVREGQELAARGAVRLEAEARRRHKFGVGGDGIAVFSREPGGAVEKGLPAGSGHGKSPSRGNGIGHRAEISVAAGDGKRGGRPPRFFFILVPTPPPLAKVGVSAGWIRAFRAESRPAARRAADVDAVGFPGA